MKKFFCLIIAILITCSLIACNSTPTSPNASSSDSNKSLTADKLIDAFMRKGFSYSNNGHESASSQISDPYTLSECKSFTFKRTNNGAQEEVIVNYYSFIDLEDAKDTYNAYKSTSNYNLITSSGNNYEISYVNLDAQAATIYFCRINNIFIAMQSDWYSYKKAQITYDHLPKTILDDLIK